MINVEEMIRSGFKIVNGRLCDRYGNSCYGAIDVVESGWSRPCTEYRFDNYELHEYTIQKATQYDEWYFKKGYREICKLYYYGGKNWSSF